MEYHQQFMRDLFSQRQRKNSRYSLRSFSRDLEIHAGSLSQILNGKRKLTLRQAHRVLEKVPMKPRQRHFFLRSVAEKSVLMASSEKQLDLNEKHFQIIAEWEHYAVLTLMETTDFKPDLGWLSERLGLSRMRIEEVVKRLIGTGLIQTADGRFKAPWKVCQDSVKTPTDISSAALQQAHREELDLAQEKMTMPLPLRDYSSTQMAISVKNLEKAKKRIQDFHQDMMALLEDAKSKEVYLLAVQLFPLTKIRE